MRKRHQTQSQENDDADQTVFLTLFILVPPLPRRCPHKSTPQAIPLQESASRVHEIGENAKNNATPRCWVERKLTRS